MIQPVKQFERWINRLIVPRSLLWRSILIVVLPVVLLQVVLTLIFYNRHWDTITRWLATGVAGEVAIVAEMLVETNNTDERIEILDLFRRHAELTISFEPDGVLADTVARAGIDMSDLGHIDSKIVDAFQDNVAYPFAIDLHSELPARAVVYVQLPDGLLRVLAPRKRVTTTTTQLLLVWMVGASAVLIIVAVHFIRLQVSPIRQLAKAMDSFGKGRDVGDFPPRGAAETRRAAMAFNTMRARILRHMSQRTDMLAAVSHDLRTPLTRMRLELEMLGSDDEMVKELKTDVEDMIELVEMYLAFVRSEELETVEEIELTHVMDSLRKRVERAGKEIDITSAEGVSLSARPIAIRRCLANLVDNACRHASWIGIAASKQPREIEITIEDDGPGIPADQRENVFQPFVRLDESRRRKTGGTGLGLSIARDIAMSHGGDISLASSSRGGLKAVVRIPS